MPREARLAILAAFLSIFFTAAGGETGCTTDDEDGADDDEDRVEEDVEGDAVSAAIADG